MGSRQSMDGVSGGGSFSGAPPGPRHQTPESRESNFDVYSNARVISDPIKNTRCRHEYVPSHCRLEGSRTPCIRKLDGYERSGIGRSVVIVLRSPSASSSQSHRWLAAGQHTDTSHHNINYKSRWLTPLPSKSAGYTTDGSLIPGTVAHHTARSQDRGSSTSSPGFKIGCRPVF
jgi:hypothetical protein